MQLVYTILCGLCILQESHRDPETLRETGTVLHLFGNIPRTQSPFLPPRLLSQMHPAVVTATEERPRSGVPSML